MPAFAIEAMREAIPQFAKQIKGCDLAGEILSAGVDGIRVTEAVSISLASHH